MSHYHPNVVWESEDGTWNQGFYACLERGEEWKEEFAEDVFEELFSGYPSETALDQAARCRANPGSSRAVRKEHHDYQRQLPELERMARAIRASEETKATRVDDGTRFENYVMSA